MRKAVMAVLGAGVLLAALLPASSASAGTSRGSADAATVQRITVEMTFVPNGEDGAPQPMDVAVGDCGRSFLFVNAVSENDEVHIDYGFEINRRAYAYNGFWSLFNQDTDYSDSGVDSGTLLLRTSWERQFNVYSDRGEVTVNAYLVAYVVGGTCTGTRILEETVLVL